MGVPNICHLEGGFSAWKNAQLPVAEQASKTSKASRTKSS